MQRGGEKAKQTEPDAVAQEGAAAPTGAATCLTAWPRFRKRTLRPAQNDLLQSFAESV
jgi:hypothetical protein